ncbi:hypothetical protein T492DRAFT_1065707 [Pavlovales sp. CCMP2436]|nr:hypothetical protein T492DRAFT_1065707 [Pavlovales sp. CCMP2436]
MRAAVRRLRVGFLQGWPLGELMALAGAVPGWPSEKAQAAVFDAIFGDHGARAFPPSVRRTAKLLKLLLKALEDGDEEVEMDERLLHTYASLPVATPGDGVEWSYLHYHLAVDAPPIVLRTADAFGRGAETGSVVWDAGVWLACYALARPELFAARRLVELGAGCGLLSCALARQCAPRELIATDAYEETLANVQHNLDANGIPDVPVLASDAVAPYVRARRSGSPAGEGVVCCARLDWFDPEAASALGALEPDLVLAADCVYNEDLLDGLVRTIRALITPSSSRPAASALIASKRRSEQTWAVFQAALARHNLRSEEEDISCSRGDLEGGAGCAGLWRLCDPTDITLLRLTVDA